MSRMLKHNCMCDRCKTYPIVGRRWSCTMCLGLDFCNKCFDDNDHKVSHLFDIKPPPATFTAVKLTEHPGVRCNLCKQKPLIGTRWKCLKCNAYNLCNFCYATDSHPTNHQFSRHSQPNTNGEVFPLRAPIVPMRPDVMAKKIQKLKEAKKEAKAVALKRANDEKAKQEAAKKKELDGFTPFQIAGLKRHNECRAKHGVQPLKLDRALCDLAADWARQMASRGGISHRPNNKAGENVYAMFANNLNASDPKFALEATNWWYNEIKYYRFGSGGFSAATGHFTAVVWKATNRMGIAGVKGSRGVFVCANYLPAGNMMGQFNNNVLPLK